MNAIKIGDEIGLVFTKVLDEIPLGMLDEDEEVSEVTDRDYWLKRAHQSTVKMADEMLELISGFTQGYSLKYNKFYIGLAKDGQTNNFALFRPKKSNMRLELKHPKSETIDSLIEENDLDDMGYDTRWGAYRIRLTKGEIKKKEEVLVTLLKMAESHRNG
jgi:hypothetical protein